MMANTDRYIVEESIHGECDITGFDSILVKVIGGYYITRDLLPVIDARADALIANPDSDFSDMEEAFKHVLDKHAGKTLILHYPNGDGPQSSITHTVENVEHFELSFGDTNEVYVEFAGGGSETYEGTGLTVSGMS